jgi:hypothetical protein
MKMLQNCHGNLQKWPRLGVLASPTPLPHKFLFAPWRPPRWLPFETDHENSCAMKDLLATQVLDLESAVNRWRPDLFAPVSNLAHLTAVFAVIEL